MSGRCIECGTTTTDAVPVGDEYVFLCDDCDAPQTPAAACPPVMTADRYVTMTFTPPLA